MAAKLKLISHKLCPYVQRAVIALTEKGVPFERIDIDLADKPDWFLALSPLGKTPVLQVDDTAIFESAVILEYLEETQPKPLHPADPLSRAEHRGWIEFGSAVLSDIAGFYAAPDEATFAAKRLQLQRRFAQLETRVRRRPGSMATLLAGRCGVRPGISLFRCVRHHRRVRILSGKPKLARWRKALAVRPSVCFGGQRRLSRLAAPLPEAAEFVARAAAVPRRCLGRYRTLASRISR